MIYCRNRAILVGLIALVLATGQAIAQPSSGWIQFGQDYYKVRVGATGMHRLTYADLQAAGVPVNAIDPRRINLFHRGAEQAIVVTGQNDAVFDPGDVIEFFGRKNDGTLDADLYDPPTAQPHPYYNLFSDTAAYFLTWNPLPVPGKRMENFFEVNSLALPVELAHQHEDLRIFTNEFSIVSEPEVTRFTQGEAWTGTTICTVSGGCTGQQDFLIDNLVGGVSSAGSPSLSIQLTGRDDMFHNVEIYGGASAGSLRLMGTLNFFRFETPTLNVPLAWTDIGPDGKMTIRVKMIATSDRDVISVSYIKVMLPQDYNARLENGKVFRLSPNPGGKSYVEIQNPVAAARLFDITDPGNVRVIGTTPAGGGLGAVVNQTLDGRTLYMTNTTLSAPLKKVTFRLITPSQHDYLIVSHRSLMNPALGYPDPVKAYAEHRASAAGGAFDTLTVSMDQLYDQFNYGEISPRAIYEFMKFMDASGDPRFLFLVGKGLEATLGYHRKTTHAPGDFHDLVPSAGIPGGDMAFTAGLAGSTFEPGIPVGRLTASTPTQVAAYLNKVKESEALPFDALWRKDLLHLSGGIQAGEPQLFRQFVDGFKAIAEADYLGGQTVTISKQTLNVELINVKDQVNKGLSLITFYGHSGPGTIDIDIGYVSDPVLGYQNAGKYPGFLINGCNAGRFFDNRVTFGEDWMLTPNKGAKSFIAHSSFGFVNPLRQYSETFYEVAFGDSTYIHKGVGEVQKEVGRRYLAANGSTTLAVAQVQQMVLLGDPAVSLFGATKPDYEINPGAVAIRSFDDSPVTAQTDSFAVEFQVRNFGRTDPKPLTVRVRRTLGDGTVVDYDSLYAPVLYSSTLRLVIRQEPGNTMSGNNQFMVLLDADQSLDELSELNNVAVISYFISSNGPRNLFPHPYAVVGSPNVDLVFQHSDLTAGVRDFVVEFDTAATFGSPYLSRVTVPVTGLGRRAITLLPTDSLVYYWRTRLANPLPGESEDWVATSFTFISGRQGWAQSKYPQKRENDTTGLTWNTATKRMEFISNVTRVDVLTYGSANPNTPTGVSLKINGDEFNIASQGQPCRNNTLNLLAFDKNSAAPYAGIPFSLFDPRTCGREPQMINNFNVAEMDAGTNGLAQWVANIQPSDSVIIFSIGDAGYASWTAGIKQSLAELGVGLTQLDGLQSGEPFVVLARKGSAPGTAALLRPTGAPANAQSLEVASTVSGRNTSGTLSTGRIGPALAWSEVTLNASSISAADSVSMDVYGVTLAGDEVKLKSVGEGPILLNDIDAEQYPWIRLAFHTVDSVDLTAAQLRHWVVSYTSAAEGVLTFDGALEPQSLEEGMTWTGSYGFVNISDQAFPDSLTVRTDVLTRSGRQLDRSAFRISAPAPGDTAHFEIKVNTKSKGGLNDVTVLVNPRLQPEMYYDNNVLPLYEYLDVAADETGPVLDVTIDGRRVVNGDVISAHPEILARVIDKNPFLLKADTTGVNLYIQFPCDDLSGCAFQRLNFTDPDVTWTPATPTQEFNVTYRPATLAPGAYVLQMEAADANGNLSGDEPYRLEFRVSDTDAFVVQSVYPNPSPDRFYFKLFIGSEVPSDFRLDVFTSTGQPIQWADNNSLSELHVGTNEVEVAAVDGQGHLLPPGIYLYRFTVVLSGRVVEQTGRLAVVR